MAAIVRWWLHPVITQLSSALPGVGAGDNVTFVWNLWWMRYVIHHPGLSFFFTSFLFYPVGADLTLHTHTALPAFVAAIAGPSSLIASQNLLIIADLFLNFVCGYALAYRLTRHVGGALAASLVFGASPFIGAHLAGHFNLIAAWIVPLVALLWEWAAASRSSLRAAVCGLAMGVAAYVDYYLFVYAVVLVAILACGPHLDFASATAPRRPFARRVLLTVAALLGLDLVLIAAIMLSDADRIALGPIHLSVRTVRNPVTAAWLLLLAAGVAAASGRVRVGAPSGARRRVLIPATLALVLVLLPLIVRGVRLWSHGGYVSQHYEWRSAPSGIDVAGLAIGNPSNLWWGTHVQALYSAWRIDRIEAVGWIPLGALVLAAIAIRSRGTDPAVRRWTSVAAVFFIWALGPWLMVAGRQSPVVLPAILIRYVPVVANARMPGRAMVGASLALAQLAAFGIASLGGRGRRGRIIAWALGIVIVVDCAPAQPPVFQARVPAQYASLHGPAGAVCELPLGLRDGFGETGTFDAAVMLNQTVHERPILGGFVARLPPSLIREYRALPTVSSLLRLSAGGRLSDEVPGDARRNTAQLAALGIAYIVVNRHAASADLQEYLQLALTLRALGEQDGRAFYELVR